MRRESFESLKEKVDVATGRKKADLVFKNAKFVNVFSEEIESGDIAIKDGIIVGIGDVYEGEKEIDMTGKILSPSFIDSHIHLESAIVSPYQFRDAVVSHGTGTVIVDPHEIANVSGIEGIKFILDNTKDLDLDVRVMLPSCVPASPLDKENGGSLEAKDLKDLYEEEKVLGLAEMMNAYGIDMGDKTCLDKCVDAINLNKQIDGHAPNLSGKNLNAYITCDIKTDHECSFMEEALEKLRKGVWIEVREGTACHNLMGLLDILKAPYHNRVLFATDDKHPGDLINLGHIDHIVKLAIENGIDPIIALKVASFNAAQHYGFRYKGAIAPGFYADIIVLDDLKDFKIDSCYLKGKKVSEGDKVLEKFSEKENIDKSKYPKVYHSFNMKELTKEDFEFEKIGKKQRVVELIPGGVLTKLYECDIKEKEGTDFGVNLDDDIVKCFVVERHKNTGHIGKGFLHNFGLKKGAIASSTAHDSHNLIVVGTNASDMALAANVVKKNEGGLAVVADGKVLGEIAFEIAGLMTSKDLNFVEDKMNEMKKICFCDLGVNKVFDPFMTLAFVALPVIPDLAIDSMGLIDVNKQEIIEPIY